MVPPNSRIGLQENSVLVLVSTAFKAFEFSVFKKFYLNHFSILKTLAVIKIESGASSPSSGVLKTTLSDVDLISSPDRVRLTKGTSEPTLN